jgi:hypothetical protein
MRIEQFMPTTQFDYSQWFVNCAQVNIIGPGGGKPTGFAKFPGSYKIDDPVCNNTSTRNKYTNITPQGLWIPVNQADNGGYVPDEEMRLTEYKPPGPSVWTG